MYKKFLRTTLFLCLTALGSSYSQAIDWGDAIEKSGSKPKWDSLTVVSRKNVLHHARGFDHSGAVKHYCEPDTGENAGWDQLRQGAGWSQKLFPGLKDGYAEVILYVKRLAHGDEFPKIDSFPGQKQWGLFLIKRMIAEAKMSQ